MATRTSEAAPGVMAARWPTTSDDIPRGANVVLGFHGLMCFCHRHGHGDRNCEVGVHNSSVAHNITITVYSVSPSFDPPHQMDMRPFSVFDGPFNRAHTGNLRGNIVRFDVDEPRISGVSYFQRGATPREHPNNFRHILDLEHDFYPGVALRKKPHTMGPRIRINHGLFYSLCTSVTRFQRVEATDSTSNPTPIGSVARMVGANIYLENDGRVTLKMSGADDVKMNAEDGKFFVLVDNGCGGCRDNDFHLYYDTFDQPVGSPRFDVVRTSPGNPSPPAGSPCALIERIVKDRSSDDTPCGAAGFGASGGLE